MIPIVSAAGVLGQRAELPCEIASRSSEDTVRMVLWFKEGDGEPIFSVDLRNMSNKKVWSSPTVFNDRASFKMAGTARLVVSHVNMDDESMYRCRVDFKNSPTKNIKINLTVIRRPQPKVVWFLESQLIEGRTEVYDNMVKNVITIDPVARHHLHSRLACNASNTNLITASIRQITLDVNLKPLSVDIITKDERPYLSAEKTYRIECRVKGSRPGPTITWYKNSKLLVKHPVKTDKEIHHNVTGGIILSNISLVLQKVSRQSAGEYSCMAINTEGRGASQPIILAVKCKSLLILPGF
ncbi:hypothetical protein M8J76_001218 [Diaphorina citri]|nr:hypothetical protein M8J76_001218 [Diaphorina citri]